MNVFMGRRLKPVVARRMNKLTVSSRFAGPPSSHGKHYLVPHPSGTRNLQDLQDALLLQELVLQLGYCQWGTESWTCLMIEAIATIKVADIECFSLVSKLRKFEKIEELFQVEEN